MPARRIKQHAVVCSSPRAQVHPERHDLEDGDAHTGACANTHGRPVGATDPRANRFSLNRHLGRASERDDAR